MLESAKQEVERVLEMEWEKLVESRRAKLAGAKDIQEAAGCAIVILAFAIAFFIVCGGLALLENYK